MIIDLTEVKINIDEKNKWFETISGCLKNERQAQENLYRHFFPIMERMVMRYTQDEDQIIDILNNGFLKVFQKIDKYTYQGSFEGWVRKIIFRSLSDYFRKSRRDLAFLIYEEEFKKEPSQPSDHKLYYQDLIQLLDNLPETQMQVFHLFAVEGFTHKEISERLNINQNTCRWHLAQARKVLQNEYSKKYQSNYNEAG